MPLPLVLLCAFFILSACGVKRAPIAPESKGIPPTMNLDCSPNDENCDKTDPNYQPRKR